MELNAEKKKEDFIMILVFKLILGISKLLLQLVFLPIRILVCPFGRSERDRAEVEAYEDMLVYLEAFSDD